MPKSASFCGVDGSSVVRSPIVTGSGPAGSDGRRPVPSLAGSKPIVWTFQSGVGTEIVKGPADAVVTDCPTIDSGPQEKARNRLYGHGGTAGGAPSRPGGRCRTKSLTGSPICSVLQPPCWTSCGVVAGVAGGSQKRA